MGTNKNKLYSKIVYTLCGVRIWYQSTHLGGPAVDGNDFEDQRHAHYKHKNK